MIRVVSVVMVMALLGCNELAGTTIPRAIEFGPVDTLAPVTVTVPIRNLSTKNGTKLSIELSTGDFVADQYAKVLAAEETWNLTLTWTPSHAGTTLGELIIHRDGIDAHVKLRAQFLAPELTGDSVVRLETVTLDPGASLIAVGRLTLFNAETAGSALTVQSLSVDDPTLCLGSRVDGACVAQTLQPIEPAVSASIDLSARITSAGEHVWKVTVRSNDPYRPVVVITVSLTVRPVMPCLMDFGVSLTLRTAKTTLTVRAPDGAVCRIEALSFVPLGSPAQVRLFRESEWPTTITGTQSFSLYAANPTSEARVGTLHVESFGESPRETEIRTAPRESCLVFEPPSLELETIESGCHAYDSLSLHNRCDHSVRVKRTRLIGGIDLNFGERADDDIGAGASESIAVSFDPRMPSVVEALLAVTVGDSVEAVALVNGRATEPTVITEVFHVPDVDRRDLIIAVDTSPSFTAGRNALGDRLIPALMASPNSCSAFRIGFVAADGEASTHALARNAYDAGWTSLRDPEVLMLARSAFDALPEGSETEACIGPVVAALADADAGASIAAFCLTDALEQSTTPFDSLDAFRVTAPSTRWSVAAGRPGSSCLVEAGDDGTHASLVDAGGGSLFDICTVTWADLFGTPPECQQSVFTPSRPMRMLVQFLVNGQSTPVILTAEGPWAFDGVPPGATVELSYAPRCQ